MFFQSLLNLVFLKNIRPFTCTKITDLLSKGAFFACVGVIWANNSSREGKDGVGLGGGMVGSTVNGGTYIGLMGRSN